MNAEIKTAIPVMGIPYYNRPDLLERCLASIDFPIADLVVVEQGPAATLFEAQWFKGMAARLLDAALIRGATVIRHPNAGVAGAWNEIVKLFPARWWMLVNNDIQFTPGDLAKMQATVESKRGGAGMMYGNHGASWFSITDACIAQVGLFDENIYPAYLEDCDYAYRMKLLGMSAVNVEQVQAIHGDGVDGTDTTQGSRTIHSDPELRLKNGITHGNNFNYYRAKWGGNNGQEIYKHPFCNPEIPAWAWRFDPRRRAEQKMQF